MKKIVDMPQELIDLVNKYADKYCEGNFSMAVRMILANGVKDEIHNK